MTRAEQPQVVDPTPGATDEALAADSRDRAHGALLQVPALRRLYEAHFTSGIGDALALLVLVLLTVQAALHVPASGEPLFGGEYRGLALAVTAAFAVRLLATGLAGVLLLGPVAGLLAPNGPLDRRWTMIGADGLRAALLIVAPLWIDWVPDTAYVYVLATVFVVSVAERIWVACRDSVAHALLPPPPPEGAAIRPLPDHQDALRRLWLRGGYLVLPVAAVTLVAASLVSNLLATGIDWFDTHQAALASYVAAGYFAAAISVLYFLRLPQADARRPVSPLHGLRRPAAGTEPDKGRTGAIPVLVLGCAAVAAAVAAAAALGVLRVAELGGGPVAYGLLTLGLTGGVVAGVRLAPSTLRGLSRRRLFALAIALTGLGLFGVGLISDPATVLFTAAASGLLAGIAARTGHTLLDQETEEFRRPQLTQHLHAVVRVAIALAVLAGPLAAALIGPHRVVRGDFVLDHGGAAYTLTLVGVLLLPVAAIVLGRTDDRRGVPLRKDLSAAVRGGAEPVSAPAEQGFFIAVEGGDGAGKSTQVEALAEWIRSKGHEVVVTREPGATPIGQRLRGILLDVASGGLSHQAEALLYAADRAEHVQSVVRPALERGAVVITDRYVDSSVAYQGAGRDLSAVEISRISRWATDGLVPHLTVLLDVSPETARERFTEAPDRLESEPNEFHQRVRSGFLALAAADPARYLVIDAGQDPESVTMAARHRLDQLLPLSEAELRAQAEARRKAEEEARRLAEEERKRKEEEARLERERKEEEARLERERQEEEARLERERQEELARQQAAEAERRRLEEEERRRVEEARRAEEARLRAEEERRAAEEERQRREAEERLRREEEERRRREAEEEARLRAQAEERRREKQRLAEEALLRAEEARAAAADNATTVQIPHAYPGDDGRPADNEETAVLPRPDEAAAADETRQLPRIEDEPPVSRRRPEWAEETPLDDVPTLADELLGPRPTGDEPDDEDTGGRRRR
ncbi:dTMP kinase [Streptomyces sp. DSM 44915]|uniref:Thymidylate kinase n=1 Tax=Streptomyces chisholmiae TaxID=3075540 RepID=A0ABU2JPH7_9ACTN|nr:dTMP kinase [Streptomyces sp. DSM 44915]MDT0266906.1 dTMP kinase [Streptomyces sp. DSM 44915]